MVPRQTDPVRVDTFGAVKKFIDTFVTEPMIPLQIVPKSLYDEGERLKGMYPRKEFVGFVLFTKYTDMYAIIFKTKSTQSVLLYDKDSVYAGGYETSLRHS